MTVTLRKLARIYGVQGAYNDITGRRRTASEEELTATLHALGVDTENPFEAWRARALELWGQLAEPVVVAWDGAAATLGLRLPAGRDVTVEAELSGIRSWSTRWSKLPLDESADVEGQVHEIRTLTLPPNLPVGYHSLRIQAGGREQTTLVIAAPSQAYLGDLRHRRLWGVFAPIYALRSESDWGAGDYTHMEHLGEWVAELGGGIVATLPFCASFLDTLFAPSPYAPASRLFWNELFVDPARAPGAPEHPETLVDAHAIQKLRAAPLVDYRAAWTQKRRVLEQLCERLFQTGGSPSFDAFLERRPAATDYARFRAATERFGRPFRDWPSPQREGQLRAGDWDPAVERLHLYIQWLADTQIDALAEKARLKGPGLYVDLPLGVHDCGYDAWRYQDLYVKHVNVGAPPDSLFTGGQNWGFPPLHPIRCREDRYAHVIEYLGHITRKAGILRIDHVMGLHRLFWIPWSIDTRRGVYVRYPAEELYAILSVESHRNRCLIVGENLGTVPTYVNREMRRHGFHTMYVLQYVLAGKRLAPVSKASVASLNTHDMPPFAAYWRGMDIDDRRDLGLMDQGERADEHRERQEVKQRLVSQLREGGWLDGAAQAQAVPRRARRSDTDIDSVDDGAAQAQAVPRRARRSDTDIDSVDVVRDACTSFLGASKARMVLVNLEDLWLETVPQNVPGIGDDRRPVWRRRLRLTLDEARSRSATTAPLSRLDAVRNDEDPARG
jgi:4-alpha-glucanotransferase